MKKASVIILSLMLVVALSACGTSKEKPDTKSKPMSESEIEKLFSNPEDFKDRTATLVGKVFGDVKKEGDKTSFQMWHDTENFDKTVNVNFDDEDLSIKEGDYVKVTGLVEGKAKDSDTTPQIKASKIKVSDYKTLIKPALKTIKPNETIKEAGISITIEKVEFAGEETRLYTKVTNNSDSDFRLYTSRGKLLQKDERLGVADVPSEANYPEIADTLSPGATSSGIIVFPAIEKSSFQVTLEGMSGGFGIDIEPFVFEIKVK